mgnify:CR=1 FL=1
MSFSLDIPRLRLNASYNLKGRDFTIRFRSDERLTALFVILFLGNILLLPLIGTGDVTILLKNINFQRGVVLIAFLILVAPRSEAPKRNFS